jgi:hypothetical protein
MPGRGKVKCFYQDKKPPLTLILSPSFDKLRMTGERKFS